MNDQSCKHILSLLVLYSNKYNYYGLIQWVSNLFKNVTHFNSYKIFMARQSVYYLLLFRLCNLTVEIIQSNIDHTTTSPYSSQKTSRSVFRSTVCTYFLIWSSPSQLRSSQRSLTLWSATSELKFPLFSTHALPNRASFIFCFPIHVIYVNTFL